MRPIPTLALAVASASAVLDTTPPVLSLDLTGIDTHSAKCDDRNTNTGSTHQCSSATYSKSCPVWSDKDDTTAVNCPEPHVTAYDHHDGQIDTITKVVKIFLKSEPGEAYTVANQIVSNVNYTQRGEFVITYDAEDYSGNQAETITFAMILTDGRAPTITPLNIPAFEACEPLDQTEAAITARATRHITSTNAFAQDLYDGDVSSKMIIRTKSPAANADWVTHAYQASIPVDTSLVGTHQIEYTSADYASIFGNNNVDNQDVLLTNFIVQDTVNPSLFCKSKPGTDRENNLAVDLTSTLTESGQNSDCAARCFQMQWSALDSAAQDGGAKPCLGWEWSPSAVTCTFYSTGTSVKLAKVLEGCAHDNTHECGTTFTDEGAYCTDMYDSYNSVDTVGGTYKTVSPTALSVHTNDQVNDGTVGNYDVIYSCTGTGNQNATPVTRTVNVVDTTLPILDIDTSFNQQQTIQHSAGYAPDMQNITSLQQGNVGFTCLDQCAGDITDDTVTSWHVDSCDGASTSFDTLVPGTYALKYVCSDTITASVSNCRTVINVDSTLPIITITGQQFLTLEAAQGSSYIDQGAQCSDAVDGIIAQVNIEGDQFLLNVTGSHDVVYTCQDSASNQAIPYTRTVVIKDYTCPTCSVDGTVELTVEASFPYTDAGAQCSDTLDGTTNVSTWKAGGVASTVGGTVNVEKTGVYEITYRSQDINGNWNDDDTCAGSGKSSTPLYSVRTVTVVDTLKPVIAIGYNGENGAPMTVFHKSSATDTGTGGEANPSDTHFTTTPLMAFSSESATSTPWVTGAAASAVTGLVFLGFATRRKSVAARTLVPV